MLFSLEDWQNFKKRRIAGSAFFFIIGVLLFINALPDNKWAMLRCMLEIPLALLMIPIWGRRVFIPVALIIFGAQQIISHYAQPVETSVFSLASVYLIGPVLVIAGLVFGALELISWRRESRLSRNK